MNIVSIQRSRALAKGALYYNSVVVYNFSMVLDLGTSCAVLYAVLLFQG